MENKGLCNNLDGQNIENLKYDPSKCTGGILLDNSCDSDLDFYTSILDI